MNEESFWPRFFSFFPNKKFIDLGMDRIMLLCMPCSFLWRKITFHHRFNQFPINALLTLLWTGGGCSTPPLPKISSKTLKMASK